MQWNVSLSPFIKLYHQSYTEFVKEELNFTFKERLKSLKNFCDEIDATLAGRDLKNVKTETLLKLKLKYLSLIEKFIYENDFFFLPNTSNTPKNFEFTKEIINPEFESSFENHFPELYDFKQNTNSISNDLSENFLNQLKKNLHLNGNGNGNGKSNGNSVHHEFSRI